MSTMRCIMAAVLLAPLWAQAEPAAAPELPRLRVDTSLAPPTGRTIAVRDGGDFQAALVAAKPGDVITLEAGATFMGPFRLPAKPGSRWITIRSSAEEGAAGRCDSPGKLPPPGCRVNPSHAALMPKLVVPSGPVILTDRGAHHYRLIGLEVKPHAVGATVPRQFAGQNLIVFGRTETSVNALPHHLIIDRCYVHGDPTGGARRGLAMNSRHSAVIDSHFSDFKEVGADSQAILGWNGSGPFRIENNYLEGAGENVMFGGWRPTIKNMVPADIEIRRNYFFKPLAWKLGDPGYEGTPWTVKNLFELKNARRVLIEGNLLENNWVHAQDGFGILFTVRTEDDIAPWAVVEDVTFVNNVVRRSGSGVYLIGIDNTSPRGHGRTRRVAIRNNLFDGIGGAGWGGGRLFQLQNGTEDVTIAHNTGWQTGQILMGGDAKPHSRFVFVNNMAPHNKYGIIGSDAGPGRPTLERYFPGATVRKNIMAGGSPKLYPPDNFFPSKLEKIGVTVRAVGVSDVANVGADIDALRAALGPALADRVFEVDRQSGQ